MLDGCIYHILQSLIPPADRDWHQFRQLAFLSACKLIERDVPQMLGKIPPRLLESLFQAFIYKHFYTPGKKENLPQHLVQLITHWPYEELNLFNLMPQLPPHERAMSALESGEGDGPLDDAREYLERFYEHIVKSVSQIIALRKTKPCSSSSLKKLNVSGLLGGASLFNPRTLLDNIFDSYYFSVTGNPIELNCDIWLNGNDKDSVEKVKDMMNICNGSGLKIVFHKASLWGGIPEGAIEVLSENNIEYLELRGCYLNENTASSLVMNLPHLKGLSFTCFSIVKSIHFLNGMYNLQQLDLTSLDLRDGKIAPLCFLPRGVQYLNLSDSKLESSDFDLFIDSPHPATLQQLDLTLIDFSALTTSFCESITWNPIIRLCENLPKIEVIVLKACNLVCLMEDLILPLVNFLKGMPKLPLLDLGNNYFLPHMLSKYFVNLRESNAMRYLKLSVDEDEFYDIYENTISKENIAKFIHKMISDLNENRETPLHVFFSQKKSAHVRLTLRNEGINADAGHHNQLRNLNQQHHHSTQNDLPMENEDENDQVPGSNQEHLHSSQNDVSMDDVHEDENGNNISHNNHGENNRIANNDDQRDQSNINYDTEKCNQLQNSNHEHHQPQTQNNLVMSNEEEDENCNNIGHNNYSENNNMIANAVQGEEIDTSDNEGESIDMEGKTSM